MEQYYSNERNVQILISLLKQFGIKRVVASPGSTNVTFVGSLQQDPFFEMYSCVDERSAAYMACGLAAETQEPVVLSCTGATASRNYFPALTEAYYRKLQILAVTSTQDESKIGNLIPQVIDRACQPNDTVKLSVHLQTVKDENDEWDVCRKANEAILELNHHGKGPVHINLTTTYSKDFSIKQLPLAKKICRFQLGDKLPEIKEGIKVAIYIGSHLRWGDDEVKLIDEFCKHYNAVVFNDPASNYHGKYRLDYSLASSQKIDDSNNKPELLIHLGEMSDFAGIVCPKEVWRVSEDGKLSDRYHLLTNIFEMSEAHFFKQYIQATDRHGDDSYLKEALSVQERIQSKIPELPFSHIYVAWKLSDKLPHHSTLHLGILSPLRSWSYFPLHPSIEVYCNQGGFGIDGNISSMLGASLAALDRFFYVVVGDLSFFYDLNSMGNRHRHSNMRILLINNSLGAEFHLFKQINLTYVNGIDRYLSAGGHFGHQSPDLVKHYAQDLGYEYISASTKEEFDNVYERFITPEHTDKPIIFEVFTQVDDENESLYRMWQIEKSIKKEIKNRVYNALGADVINMGKKILGKE